MDEPENIIDDEAVSPEPADAPETKNIGLSWRMVFAIVALVIVGVFAYPFIQDWLNPGTPAPSSLSEPQTAVTESEAAVQADPDSPEAQFELGNSYVRSGQLELALAAYHRAIELDPDYQTAYANLGVVYYQLQQLNLAALQYQKALELNPNDGEVAYNLGALYLQQALSSGSQPDPQKLDQAIAQIKRAMELSPELAEPYFSLGVAYTAQNESEQAIEAFETFLELDTGRDPRAKQEAERYLQNLRGQ
jgi:tetratricopeptide (TPR) repeat protein